MEEKDKISKLECYKKLRKTWKKNPGTKVHKTKKNKLRQQKKIDLKKEIQNENF